MPSVLTIDLYNGLLFLCLVPSTIESSIAFTSIARGHVSAAIVSASLSNILVRAPGKRNVGEEP